MLISLISAVLSLFISACAAFAFSRYRFKGRRTGMLFILLVQMFPQFLAIVAIYLMFVEISELYPAIGFNTSVVADPAVPGRRAWASTPG